MSGSSKDTTQVSDSEAHDPIDSDYYALHRIPVMVHKREIGKVFAEVNDNLVSW